MTIRSLLIFALPWLLVCCKTTGKVDGTPAPALAPVSIQVVHDSLISSWAEAAAQVFLSSKLTLGDGSPITLSLTALDPFEASEKIANGTLKPDAWIVPTRYLIAETNKKRVNLGIELRECKPLFSSPVVLASNADSQPLVSGRRETVALTDFLSKIVPNPGTERLPTFDLLLPIPRRSANGLAALSALLDAFNASQVTRPDIAAVRTVFRKVSVYTDRLPQTLPSWAGRVTTALSTRQHFAQHDPNGERYAATPLLGDPMLIYYLCRAEADWIPAKRKLAASQTAERLRTLALAAPAPNGLSPVKEEISDNTEQLSPYLDRWEENRRARRTIMVLDTSSPMAREALGTSRATLLRILTLRRKADQTAVMAGSGTPLLNFDEDPAQFAQRLESLPFSGTRQWSAAAKHGFDILAALPSDQYERRLVIYTNGPDRDGRLNLLALSDALSAARAKGFIEVFFIAVSDGSEGQPLLEQAASDINATYIKAPPAAALQELAEF